MAKFCGNCGFQNNDYAQVCGNCGAALPGGAPNANRSGPVNKPLANLNKLDDQKKKYLMYGGCAVGAILVLVIIISLFGGGPKGAVKKYIKGITKGKVNKIVAVMPYDDDLDKEERKERAERTVDYYEDIFEGVKVSYKISGKKKVSKEALEELNDDRDLEDAPIKKAYVYKVTVKLKEDGETEKEEWGAIVGKQKGKWVILGFLMDEDGYDEIIDELEEYD